LLSEGFDAASGPWIQCDLRKGSTGCEGQSDKPVILGLAGNSSAEQERILAIHARHKLTLWAERSDQNVDGGGLDDVFARHLKLAAATRATVRAWNLEILCQDPQEYSPILTAVVMPAGRDADHFRDVALKNYDMSLGAGLSKVKGKVFRIGHLGHFNELMLMGTLSGVEMALDVANVPHRAGGVLAAMEVLKGKDAIPLSTHQNVVA
jgi:hypothetical protein